ncbi:hypothetical protein MLD38_006659 [Melastoma candidum]|uniref:Uncharacterized protein n=1 Tax=Melastoma candidum TaxID=119954 RepID=A0ACB9RN99_9MYRT|nr:hypothetical protein MLD38_006659 [Melastoma candidum]
MFRQSRDSNSSCNTAGCGFSLTSFGKKYYIGAKIRDTMLFGPRVKFSASLGRLVGAKKVVDGGNFEATFRRRDFPERNELVSLTVTVLSFEMEMILDGNVQLEFPLTRDTKLSIVGNLNSWGIGQLPIKTSTSEHLEIATIALLSIFRGLFTRKVSKDTGVGNLDGG